MKNLTSVLIATMTAGNLFADVSVEDIKCTQRYPWNGLVDIEYTIACDDPDAEIYVNPVGFNGDTGLTVFPTHFTGDGATNAVKAGKHTMVWDAKADLGNTFATKNFQIKMYAGKKLSRYIVIDISGGTNATSYAVRHSIEGPNLADDTCRTTEIWMRLILPGTFMMGSPKDELGRYDNEDLHKVTITKPYYIGVFEVTQRQWELVYGKNPSYFASSINYATRPVESMNISQLRGCNSSCYPSSTGVAGDSFIGKLRSKTSNGRFDLPSQVQHEYACRAGAVTALYDGSNLSSSTSSENLNRLARYYYNGNNGQTIIGSTMDLGTAKVGSYEPNRLGLYDMLGNVYELCRDYYEEHLGTYPVVNPKISGGYVIDSSTYNGTGSYTVKWKMTGMGGGSWKGTARGCRSARRVSYDMAYAESYVVRYRSWEDLGFRLCAEADF